MTSFLPTAGAAIAFACLCPSQNILVPAGASIQAAIAAAPNGARILVAPGTYTERLDFLGKRIEVIGENGPLATILDGGGAAPVVRFASGETSATLLQGFTVRGGVSSTATGGIQVGTGSQPSIEDCIVRDNVGRFGGGISGSPILRRCSIIRNTANLTHGGGIYGAPAMRFCVVAGNRCSSADGGGLYITGGLAGIEDCVFADNGAIFANSSGGAIAMHSSGSALIRRSLFVDNFATGGAFPAAGGAIRSAGLTQIERCTFVGNQLTGSRVLGGAVYGPAVLDSCIVRGNSAPQLDAIVMANYCNVEGGFVGGGNFDLDPQFANAIDRDFHLTAGSPCIDTGALGATDPDGTRADVGAFPFQTLYTRSNVRQPDWTATSWPEISSVVGGRAILRTLVGAGHAGAAFSVAGTISGTSPGVSFGGFAIPLNPDFYTDYTLTTPNSALLANSFAALGPGGTAETIVTLSPRIDGFPVAITAHHVNLVLGSGTPLLAVTNALECRILPR